MGDFLFVEGIELESKQFIKRVCVGLFCLRSYLQFGPLLREFRGHRQQKTSAASSVKEFLGQSTSKSTRLNSTSDGRGGAFHVVMVAFACFPVNDNRTSPKNTQPVVQVTRFALVSSETAHPAHKFVTGKKNSTGIIFKDLCYFLDCHVRDGYALINRGLRGGAWIW